MSNFLLRFIHEGTLINREIEADNPQDIIKRICNKWNYIVSESPTEYPLYLIDSSNKILTYYLDKRMSSKKDYTENYISNIIKDNWESLNGKVKIPQNYMTLYHGSRNGIIGDIRPDKSRTSCDFGDGFYAGDLVQQAKLLIKDNGSAKLLYTIGVDLSLLNTYEFSNDLEKWALYITYNRNKIEHDKYAKLDALVSYINSHDVVVGLIADDSMWQVFNEFLSEALTFEGLMYCLSKVDLGRQFIFKTQKACDQLRYLDISTLNTSEYADLVKFHDKLVEERTNVVEQAKELFRSGERLRDILERYK